MSQESRFTVKLNSQKKCFSFVSATVFWAAEARNRGKKQKQETRRRRWEILQRAAQWSGTPRARPLYEWVFPMSTACADARGRRVVYIFVCIKGDNGLERGILWYLPTTHELAWIWTDFLSEHRRATDFVRQQQQDGRQLETTACTMLAQDSR